MILVVADHDAGQAWCTRLADCGWRAVWLPALADVESALPGVRPGVLLVEWPTEDGDAAAALEAVMGGPRAPSLVVLLADPGAWADSARLAAGKRRGVVVFEKPVGLSVLAAAVKGAAAGGDSG